MKIYQHIIPYDKPGTEFKLIPYGDVHLGAAACERERFREMLRRHGKQKNTYLIDMGDACECIIPVDNKRFRPSSVHPALLEGTVPAEDWIDTEINWYVEDLKKYIDTDKHLGIVAGNHHDTIAKRYGTDPTRRIAARLGIKNLGYCFYYRLIFKHTSGRTSSLLIYGHHGWGGGGRTDGGSITKYARDARNHTGTDICIYGHDHKKWVYPIIRTEPIGNKQKERRALVANTGTFLKTHGSTEAPTYSELAGYPPTDLGYVIFKITVLEDGFDIRGMV